MSNTKPKRRKNRGFPPSAEQPRKPQTSAASVANTDKRPVRWGLIVLFLTISIGGTYLAIYLRPKSEIPRFSFEKINTLQHDNNAFTQGLVIDDGYIWESTGRWGESTVRKIDLETGEILLNKPLPDEYFGEGLAKFKDRFYQLTWKAGKAFVYDENLNKVKEFEYKGQGWGLASDGNRLMMSDGSTIIKFVDPETFEIKSSIRVRRGDGRPVGQLNELEYAGGKLYANVYLSDRILEIDPETGNVTGLIDLSGLWPKRDRPVDGILNGIAVMPGGQHPSLLVTGKLCPNLYEIRLKQKEERSR